MPSRAWQFPHPPQRRLLLLRLPRIRPHPRLRRHRRRRSETTACRRGHCHGRPPPQDETHGGRHRGGGCLPMAVAAVPGDSRTVLALTVAHWTAAAVVHRGRPAVMLAEILAVIVVVRRAPWYARGCCFRCCCCCCRCSSCRRPRPGKARTRQPVRRGKEVPRASANHVRSPRPIIGGSARRGVRALGLGESAALFFAAGRKKNTSVGAGGGKVRNGKRRPRVAPFCEAQIEKSARVWQSTGKNGEGAVINDAQKPWR